MNSDQVLKSARDEAAQQAQRKMYKNVEQKVNQVLSTTPFSQIKEVIKMARKSRMRTVQHYMCDVCDKVIPSPRKGFVIQGNIYVADPSCRGGLIGNNFPSQESFSADDVKTQVFCRTCFFNALGVSEDDANQVAYDLAWGEEEPDEDEIESKSLLGRIKAEYLCNSIEDSEYNIPF